MTGGHGRAGGRSMRTASLALALLAACTAGPGPPPAGPTGGPTPTGPPPVVLGVAATISGPGAGEDRPFLDGMELAREQINEDAGVLGRPLALEVVDDGGRADETSTAVGELLERPDPVAFLVVGPGRAVTDHRLAIQADGRPVMLLGGDLYTGRALFPQVFQTGPPMRWQARVLARYLVRDRRYRRVAVMHEPGRSTDGDAIAAALREEDVPPRRVSARGPDALPPEGADAVQAVVFAGSAPGAVRLAESLASLSDPPRLAVTAESLRTDADLPPGTVAPGTYVWAPWARPIERVREFREAFRELHGGLPVGAEQEGYDAVGLLVRALEETEGRSGPPMVRALERNRPDGPVLSGLPLVLGPDDHTLTDETWLGLFAVAGPDEEAEPWLDGTPWRPVIRTFTYDGRRTVFHEADRRVFFPSWRENRPSPRFHRSRWGIVTRAAEDPLH